jgi:hypothetical protein
MPEKLYTIYFDDENKMFVFFETMRGHLFRFVVKYSTKIDDIWYEVLRYDSAHDIPHIDILDPDGEVKQKIWLSHLSNEGAVEYAKKDIRQNYVSYKENFIQWKSEK